MLMFMPLWYFRLIWAWICKRSANSYAKSRCLLFLFTLLSVNDFIVQSIASRSRKGDNSHPWRTPVSLYILPCMPGAQRTCGWYLECTSLFGTPLCYGFFPYNFRVNIVKGFLLIYDYNGYRPHPNSRF